MAASIDEAEFIWKNGELIPWAEATVHVLSTAVQFGASVFEGIRCYHTAQGPAVFRLPEHIHRLRNSWRIYRMEPGFTEAELVQASLDVVHANNLKSAYIRPMVMRGYGSMTMDGAESPIETVIPAWKWGAYLGKDALAKGVDVCVSSWARAASNTFPGMAKAAGHYNNAALIKMEAKRLGYVEAIALTPAGIVSEGSGQNVFAVIDGALVTPPIEGSNLQGITRASVFQIARDLDIDVREMIMPREALYGAEELFFAGTATEITPIRSVDDIVIGAGRMGPVTAQIQQRFLGIVSGEMEDRHGWLTPVR
ncbi:MAG: branched-chain amino acid transaminase [Rhodospirillales bacterium]|nr:branched-chain amino acid transaminase [Rhodospirillales bacterium]